MQPFLQGFVEELVKVSFVAPLQTPSTAPKPTGGISVPKPPNAVPAGQGFTAAIPTQKMESPAAPPQATGWRPSAGYKAKPGSDPKTPPPAPKSRGGGGKAGPSFVPYESAGQYMQRSGKERAYNKNLAQQAADKKYAPALKKEQAQEARQDRRALNYTAPRETETRTGPGGKEYKQTVSSSAPLSYARIPSERPIGEYGPSKAIPADVRQRHQARQQPAKPDNDLVGKIDANRKKWQASQQQKDREESQANRESRSFRQF